MSKLMQQFIDSRYMLYLVFLLAIWGFWSLPLYDIDEGAFTEATREMVETGNYISIYLNGEPRNDKPILIYWLQAASVHAFGLNEFALRLPSIVMFALWMLIVYRFTQNQTDKQTAHIATLLLALSFYISLIAKAAIADALLHVFLVLTLFDIYRYSQSEDKSRLKNIFIWMGLGFLTKGPVAIVLPAIISLIFYGSYSKWKDWLKAVTDVKGWMIFVAIVLPWHIALYFDSGWQFFQGFYLEHNVGRYAGAMEGHSGGWYYYLLAAPLIIMPFGGWLISVISPSRIWQSSFGRFAWIWFSTTLIIFSMGSTKLPHYLLYGMTGLFVWMAMDRDRLNKGRWAIIAATAFFLSLGSLPWVFEYISEHSSRLFEATVAKEISLNLLGDKNSMIAILIAIALMGLLLKIRTSSKLIWIGLVQLTMVSTIFLPSVFSGLQDGPKEVGLKAKQSDKSLVSYGVYQPSLAVYAEKIVKRDDPKGNQLVYVRVDRKNEFERKFEFLSPRLVYSKGIANLYEVTLELEP